jgi:hypothetical protein
MSLMLMHFRYTVAPSFKFIDSILKAIKNEMGFEGLRELETCLPSRWCCICGYSRLVFTIDTSSRVNAKLGGVNALPRSHALEKLVSAPFMIMGMCHFSLRFSHLGLVPCRYVPVPLFLLFLL